MATKQEVLDHIRSASLGRHQTRLEGIICSAIRIASTPALGAMKTGTSRIGGTPDLPASVGWPERRGRSLAFLAQFRLRDVAPYDADKLLPDHGVIYFFCDTEEQPWGDASERDGWKAVYTEADESALRQRGPPPNLPAASRFTPCAVRFSQEATLPPYDSPSVQSLDLSEEESEAYTELLGGFGADETGRHRLLGHPDAIQSEMTEECEKESGGSYYLVFPEGGREARMKELAERAKQWRLLFQLDTDDNAGIMWGDTGRLYFWIREESLRARDWDDVWLMVQCY